MTRRALSPCSPTGLLLGLATLALTGACTGNPTPQPPPPTPGPVATTDAPAAVAPDTERGGRLFDKWWAERPYKTGFTPDDPTTADTPDGSGGPNDDGTLGQPGDRPVLNTGHDYRLENLFGWDLRGQNGIYGPSYQNKPYVLSFDLLDPQGLDPEALKAKLTQGGDGVPAFGGVLSPDDMNHLVAFILAVRGRELAHPDMVFTLDASAPSNYRLNDGADPAVGAAHYDDACAGCHGDDGTKITLEGGAHSLGSHSRTQGYEAWLKILNGHPGTGMKRQVPEGLDGAAQGKWILDVLAALCDRSTFPKGEKATGEDAPDDDPRCGAYLK